MYHQRLEGMSRLTYKLWVLKPIDPRSEPWDPAYDSMHGLVVRARGPKAARAIAQSLGMDEVRFGGEVWLDPKLTSCKQLMRSGREECIMADIRAK